MCWWNTNAPITETFLKKVTLIFDINLDQGKVSPQKRHVKYESSITYHSKVMVNVKVFTDKQIGQKLNAYDLLM